jgi:nucleotide-binding universal stress UspA family protein
MTLFKSILVATDFSDHAQHAVRTAARLAEHNGSRLVLLHVVSPAGFKPLRRWFTPSLDVDLRTAQARTTLRRFATEITGRHGVPVRHRVVLGDAFHEILQASAAADLLVIGGRGTSRLKDLVIGSSADRLARQSRCPVLVVKQASDAYRRVLVPVDFSLHSHASLEAAAAVAPHADIHVLHVLGPGQQLEMQLAGVPQSVMSEQRELQQAAARGRIDELVSAVGMAGRRVMARLRDGNAWCAVLDDERALGADLIVAGKQGSCTIADFVLGSVARRLVSGSRSDILIVPRAHALRAQDTVVRARPLPLIHARDGAQVRMDLKRAAIPTGQGRRTA